MSENLKIAQTILTQMGGQRRVSVMTGAKDFVAIDRGIQFAIGKNSAGINKVIIRLNASDLYDVEFGNVRMNRKTFETNWKVKESANGVFAENLKAVFEHATGLYLSI